MSTTNNLPSDFTDDSFTVVAAHVTDWAPPALVVVESELEMPARAAMWFAENVEVSL